MVDKGNAGGGTKDPDINDSGDPYPGGVQVDG